MSQSRPVQWAKRLTESKRFETAIVVVIFVNAMVIGLETDKSLVNDYGHWFILCHQVCLAIFLVEIILRLFSYRPNVGMFFKEGWNVFDFIVVVASILPFAGQWAMLARLARLLRVLRLISAFPELRLIVSTLIHSIPSMFHISLLMMVLFYIYGVLGVQLFQTVDPTHWESLPIAILSLFRIVTLEDWTDIMYAAMEAYPYAWIYFVSFVIFGTFVVINLFIAVVLNNLEDAKIEDLKALATPANKNEVLKELEQTQLALKNLQEKLNNIELKQDFEHVVDVPRADVMGKNVLTECEEGAR